MLNAPTAIAEASVVHIKTDEIDITNRAFVFRASLRIAGLERSIQAEGQQIPIIVRELPGTTGPPYQIISGFRRTSAIKALGLPTVAAIIRRDLDDDQAAFRASIIENEQRSTYSDIDRALAILRCEQAGWTGLEVAELMGLHKRQKNNLKLLLTLPAPIQAAIDDPDDHFSATHGIELGRLQRRYPQIDLPAWITRVNQERLSVSKMKRDVGRAHKPTTPPRLGSIFNDTATDRAHGVFRFDAVKVVVTDLDEQERAQLRAELQELMDALG